MSAPYTQPGVLQIDLGALARNYQLLCERAPDSRIAAVVKADAYGLGAGPVVRRLADLGCTKFCVASVEEGIELRRDLEAVDIYVFNGISGNRLQPFLDNALTPVLNSIEDIQAWVATDRPAVLNVDTGISRLGLSLGDVETLSRHSELTARLRIDYLMTHLACADQPEHAMNAQQVELFQSVLRRLPAARTSIGNSAGALIGTPYQGDLVRAGIAIYGGNPFTRKPNPMEPVVSLKARVLQIRRLSAGSAVGYGATHLGAEGDKIAIVGIGYADGYPRQLGNVGFASVDGLRVPVVGRVSMDSLALDISRLAADRLVLGQYVELFGSDVTVDEIASVCGTISYEILTGMGRRLERVYLN